MASEIFGNAKPVYKAKKIIAWSLLWKGHHIKQWHHLSPQGQSWEAVCDISSACAQVPHSMKSMAYGLHESCIVSEVFTITRKIVKPATRVASKLLNLTEITFLTRVT